MTVGRWRWRWLQYRQQPRRYCYHPIRHQAQQYNPHFSCVISPSTFCLFFISSNSTLVTLSNINPVHSSSQCKIEWRYRHHHHHYDHRHCRSLDVKPYEKIKFHRIANRIEHTATTPLYRCRYKCR